MSLTIPGRVLRPRWPQRLRQPSLLRMIAGLEEISGGEVHINERNVTEVERSCATLRWCSRAMRSTRR